MKAPPHFALFSSCSEFHTMAVPLYVTLPPLKLFAMIPFLKNITINSAMYNLMPRSLDPDENYLANSYKERETRSHSVALAGVLWGHHGSLQP